MTKNGFTVTMARTAVLALLLPISSMAASDSEEKEWGFSADVGYESRYIGGVAREDTLDHGGYFTTTLGAEWRGLAFEYWEAYGSQVHFRETNFAIAYGLDITENFSAELAYIYLDFEEGDLDHETVVTLEQHLYAWVPGITATHSSQANGNFLTLFWGGELASFAGGEAEWFGEVGIDYGYFSESYDGLNHFAFGASWARPFTENLSLNLHATQVVALENLDRDDEHNSTSVGISVSAGF